MQQKRGSELKQINTLPRPKKHVGERSNSSRSQQSLVKDSGLKFKKKRATADGQKTADDHISEIISKYDSSQDDLNFETHKFILEKESYGNADESRHTRKQTAEFRGEQSQQDSAEYRRHSSELRALKAGLMGSVNSQSIRGEF